MISDESKTYKSWVALANQSGVKSNVEILDFIKHVAESYDLQKKRANDHESTIQELHKKSEDLTEETSELTDQIITLESQKDDLDATIEDLEERNEHLEKYRYLAKNNESLYRDAIKYSSKVTEENKNLQAENDRLINRLEEIERISGKSGGIMGCNSCSAVCVIATEALKGEG